MRKWTMQKTAASALLIAVGILIPMVMPKIIVPGMTFTPASHVAVFIAMMISPDIAVAVAVGTTIGFHFSLGMLDVTLRAATHIVFAALGGVYLRKRPQTLSSLTQTHVFSFAVALIHGACEFAVITALFFGGAYAKLESIQAVLLLVGLGTVVHSLVDFELSWGVYKALQKTRGFTGLITNGR